MSKTAGPIEVDIRGLPARVLPGYRDRQVGEYDCGIDEDRARSEEEGV